MKILMIVVAAFNVFLPVRLAVQRFGSTQPEHGQYANLPSITLTREKNCKTSPMMNVAYGRVITLRKDPTTGLKKVVGNSLCYSSNYPSYEIGDTATIGCSELVGEVTDDVQVVLGIVDVGNFRPESHAVYYGHNENLMKLNNKGWSSGYSYIEPSKGLAFSKIDATIGGKTFTTKSAGDCLDPLYIIAGHGIYKMDSGNRFISLYYDPYTTNSYLT